MAHNNAKLVEPTITAIGAISERAERGIRRKLCFPPPSLITINRSPAGLALSLPIRMETCEGRVVYTGALYFEGWPAVEHPFPSLLIEVLSSARDGLFFDIGANAGLYSLLSKSVCPKRSVHAFEPFPPVRDILKRNIALNKFAADIVLVDAAVSDATGTAEFFIPTQEHGLMETSASLSSSFRSKHSEIFAVKTVKLDDYCQQVGRDPVTVMKVDVEGAEDRVLSGATDLMARDNPIIFCEMFPSSSGWHLIPAILAKVGYLRAAIHPNMVITQEGPEPDLSAQNYILFPTKLEPLVCKVAHSVNMHYQTSGHG